MGAMASTMPVCSTYEQQPAIVRLPLRVMTYLTAMANLFILSTRHFESDSTPLKVFFEVTNILNYSRLRCSCEHFVLFIIFDPYSWESLYWCFTQVGKELTFVSTAATINPALDTVMFPKCLIISDGKDLSSSWQKQRPGQFGSVPVTDCATSSAFVVMGGRGIPSCDVTPFAKTWRTPNVEMVLLRFTGESTGANLFTTLGHTRDTWHGKSHRRHVFVCPAYSTIRGCL